MNTMELPLMNSQEHVCCLLPHVCVNVVQHAGLADNRELMRDDS